ncbi:MAG TPA: fumarylacetoacetate hydrolase family protein [Streptomyces sp.]|uniref:fumarylacetoacetate hydrolase family protein n=1 Tax=Streptomyces sp. TaxID=1931 RepID=UPI002C53A745|nr:fumarylacetoacetate hydrolase family protein [Streptomyces sp.]HWU12317.1 fumarylacetoacetate hydrolase family protein [Streptomyces sp.]
MVSSIDHAGPWALGSFSRAGRSPFPGLLCRDRVLDLAAEEKAGRPASVLALMEDWDTVRPVLESLAADPDRERWTPLDGLQVAAPVVPRQIFQAGANYRTHVIDLAVKHHDPSDGRTPEQVRADAVDQMDQRLEHPPYVFTGLPSAICGAYDDVVLPAYGKQPDWELELAAVIGRPARDLDPSQALDAVAGWVIVNDLTLRELVLRRDMPELGADWMASKNAPTFLPVGPVIVPRSAAPDPADFQLTLKLNGEVMQDESAKDMIFDVARIVAHCSKMATLLPGDLVLTGSPAGNGLVHGRLLRPDDVMDATITGLGAQRSRCVAAA